MTAQKRATPSPFPSYFVPLLLSSFFTYSISLTHFPFCILPLRSSFSSPVPLLTSLRFHYLPFRFLPLPKGLWVYPSPTRTCGFVLGTGIPRSGIGRLGFLTERVGYEKQEYGYTRILPVNSWINYRIVYYRQKRHQQIILQITGEICGATRRTNLDNCNHMVA